MNKIYIGVAMAIIVVVGIFALNSTNTTEYVSTINDEVTQLEDELAELEIAVQTGTLTSAQATEAKVKIITRLDTINASVATSERVTLTPDQRRQLAEGLDRLKNILITYQATLTAVDNTAVEADVTAKLKRGHGGGSKNLNLVVAETIDTVQEVTEEVIDDYETDENLDTQVEEIVAEEEAMEEAMDDSDTNEDDTVESEDEASIDMPTMEETGTVEMEVEEEVKVTQ